MFDSRLDGRVYVSDGVIVRIRVDVTVKEYLTVPSMLGFM